MKKKLVETKNILDAAIEGMRRLKGKKIAVIDLTTIQHTRMWLFLDLSRTSNTQVDAIARSVEETVTEMTGTRTWHKAVIATPFGSFSIMGILWCMFSGRKRNYYNLEELWSDASINFPEDETSM